MKDLFGQRGSIEGDVFISKLNVSSSYFVYCDLVDLARNLMYGKKTNLLAMFDVRGKAFEKVNYQTEEQQNFRDASTNEHVNSVTLSSKDEDGELFDFRGEKLYFELKIN